MNRSFKSLVSFAFAALAFSFAAPAMADSNCTGYCPTTPPAPIANTGLSISGLSAFQGTGAAVFEGQTGSAMVDKFGGAEMNIELAAQGGACPGGCGDSTFKVNGRAWENVKASGNAFSAGSGIQAGVSNFGQAEAMVQFTKIVVPTTTGQ